MEFPDFLAGYVRIQVSGDACERFFNLCAHHRLKLWRLLPEAEAYTACISVRDFRKLKTLVKKSHVRLRITERHGLPFFIRKYRRRRLWVLGFLAAVWLLLWLGAHVWRITLNGNVRQTSPVLYNWLQENGIYYGMRKSEVDCERLSAALRNAFPDFSWVSATLHGTQLSIQVREGSFSEETEPKEANVPSSLVAAQSGIIESIYVRSGRALVAAGDEVEKGQLLVSGVLLITDDGGTVVNRQKVRADADVMIRSRIPYHEEQTITFSEKKYTGKQASRVLLQILGADFALPIRKPSWECSDTLSKLCQLRLFDAFYLPVCWQQITVREYENLEICHTKEEILSILNSNLQYFMKNLEEKGVQIFENNVKIEWTETSAIASGVLTVGTPETVRTEITDGEEELSGNEYD